MCRFPFFFAETFMKKWLVILMLFSTTVLADRDDWDRGRNGYGYEGSEGYYGHHGHGGYRSGIVEGAIVNGVVQSLLNPYGYRQPVIVQQPQVIQPRICVDTWGRQFYC